MSSRLCGSGRLKTIQGRGCHSFQRRSSCRAVRTRTSVQANLDDDTEADGNRTKADAAVLSYYTKRMSAYSRQGNLLHARKVFDEMPLRDSVAYNVMIRDYIRSGRVEDARDIFDGMPLPGRNSVSWNSMIMGYSVSPSRKMHVALKLFLVMPDHYKDAFTWTSVISGLARDGRAVDSLRLFRQSPPSNKASPVAWASLLSGFQQAGLAHEALVLFKEMLVSLGLGGAPHSVTSALAAAADLPSLSVGRQLYSHVLRRGLGGNNRVGNSAIAMFMRCGSLDGARTVFQYHIPRSLDVFTWNSMIMGLGRHGLGAEAISTFHLMQRLGFRPDAISFLGVLQGCSHCGRVRQGRLYFHSMQRDFGVCPGPEHFVCLVDMLARAGLLAEAVEVISDMPFEATPVFWRSLLNGCRISGDLELGLCVAHRVLELEPHNAATCLMVMEMYKAAGVATSLARGGEGEGMRRRKEVAYSWVDIQGKPHFFTTRDETHQESDNIYMVLWLLTDVMTCYDD